VGDHRVRSPFPTRRSSDLGRLPYGSVVSGNPVVEIGDQFGPSVAVYGPEPDQEEYWVEPSSQTSSPGYAWIVTAFVTLRDSWYRPSRMTITAPLDAAESAPASVCFGALIVPAAELLPDGETKMTCPESGTPYDASPTGTLPTFTGAGAIHPAAPARRESRPGATRACVLASNV